MSERRASWCIWPVLDSMSGADAIATAEAAIPELCRENGWSRYSAARDWRFGVIDGTPVVSCVIDVLTPAGRDSEAALMEAPHPEPELDLEYA